MSIRHTLFSLFLFVKPDSVKAKFFISLFSILLLIPSLAFATDYYVSPSGNDSNSGSLNSPLRTISKGVTKLKAGDVLNVRSGIYAERVTIFDINGTAQSPIVIRAYPGESPIIDGAGINTGNGGAMVLIYSNYLHFIGFEIRNTDDISGSSGAGITVVGDYCKLSNCYLHDLWGSGIGVSGDYSIIEYCTVDEVCQHNKPPINAEINGTGISIRRYPTGGIIRHCTASNVYGEAISVYEATNVTIEDCIAYDFFSVGFYISDATDCVVQRCITYMTRIIRPLGSVGFGHWPEGRTPANDRNTFINNLAYGCDRNFVSYSNNNLTVSNNTFVNSNKYCGVQLTSDTYQNSVFTNNIIIQENSLPIIASIGSHPGLTFGYNAWSKTPDSDASGTGDIIGAVAIAKTGSTGAGDLTGDYFKLLNTSPAINKGTNISKVTIDFFGNPRDAATDIGAHEYVAITQKIPVTGITVTGAGGANTIATDNGTLQLSAAISPSNATTKTVSWSITNGSGQATINSAGIVTAVANGTVTARATATDGSGVYGTLLITISNQAILVAGLIVAGAGGANTIVADNGTLQLTATISPSNATNKSVTWSITNSTGQATINSAGIVAAVANGTVTARATATDGSGVYGTLVITISNQVIPVAPAVPVYVSSAIENATPSTLELTYSLTLTNSVPAASAFAVIVNSVARSVTTVSVSGSKVILTLASPVVFGNVVTVAYTKPATNPIKTTAGGEATSIGHQTVVNKVNYVNSPPVVVVNYTPKSLSGFVGEINASKSYDPNNEKLSYEWITPANVPISSSNTSTIKFLSPDVDKPTTYDFILKISDGKITQSKTLPVEVIPYKPELQEAKILKVEASSYQYPNFPHNILDGNIGTAWAADGTEQWLTLQLSEPFKVDHVKLAFQSGMKSESYFDILGSTDNVTWEPVLTKSASCGFSGDPQVFGFPEIKAEQEYSFIKLVGQCNSVNTLNYISELKLFGFGQRALAFKEQSQIIIYPNPVNEYINISIKEQALTPEFIRIINLSGKVVLEEIIEPDIKELQIPINLFNGVYIVQMGSGDITLYTQKLIVSK